MCLILLHIIKYEVSGYETSQDYNEYQMHNFVFRFLHLFYAFSSPEYASRRLRLSLGTS